MDVTADTLGIFPKNWKLLSFAAAKPKQQQRGENASHNGGLLNSAGLKNLSLSYDVQR